MSVSLEHTTVIRSVPTTLAPSVVHVEMDFCSQMMARIVLVSKTDLCRCMFIHITILAIAMELTAYSFFIIGFRIYNCNVHNSHKFVVELCSRL